MKNQIILIVLGVLAWGSLVAGLLQWLQVGPLLNNATILEKDDPEKPVNKTPYYRQSAVVFFIISAVFVADMLAVQFKKNWIFGVAAVLVVGVLVYSLLSSVRLEKQCKKAQQAALRRQARREACFTQPEEPAQACTPGSAENQDGDL